VLELPTKEKKMTFEFQVTLSLPVEAQNITDAIEEFKWDVANGPAYVYQVDTGEGVFNYDTDNNERTLVEVPDNTDALEGFVSRALDSDTWKGNDDDVFALVKRAVELAHSGVL